MRRTCCCTELHGTHDMDDMDVYKLNNNNQFKTHDETESNLKTNSIVSKGNK